jgi:photosynthetic reaction center H subunit
MEIGRITEQIDVAQVVLYMFWVFFAFLIFYLRREDRREGYPLVSEVSGKADDPGLIWIPPAKTFNLANGRKVSAPAWRGDDRPVKATPAEKFTGAPLRPDGNPMLAAVGPGSYAQRADIPDVTFEGHNRIVPLRSSPTYYLESHDPDPRGMKVIGCDRREAGTVTDVWLDRSDMIIRYLEVALSGAGKVSEVSRRVLVPMTFSVVHGTRRIVEVDAITAAQFADVPAIKSADAVTFLEEDMICAYFGAGTLYATPARQEPLL